MERSFKKYPLCIQKIILLLGGVLAGLILFTTGCRYDSHSVSPNVIDTASAAVKQKIVQSDPSPPPAQEGSGDHGEASSSRNNLSAQEENGGDDSEASSSRSDLYLGLQEFRRGNYARARQYLEAAQSDVVELKDYVLFYLAQSLAELGEHQKAILHFLMLLEEYEQSRFAPEAVLKAADNFFVLRDYKAARKYYQKSLERLPHQKEYIYFQMALLLIEEKKISEAREFFKKILVQFPGSEYAELSELCMQEMKGDLLLEPLVFSEDDHLEIIQSLMGKRQYKKALERIKQVQSAFPLSSHVSDLLYKEAFCHSKLGRDDVALDTLHRLIARYPKSRVALNSWYLTGNILWNQDRDEEAVAAYRKMVRSFDHGPSLDRAWYTMGRIYEQNKKFKKAIQCLEKVTRDFHGSNYYSESLWRIGWIYYQQRKYHKAQVHFRKCLPMIKDDSEKHLFWYWEGRAAERDHDPSAALASYRKIISDSYYSYYTWWALQRIHEESKLTFVPFQKPKSMSEVKYSDDISFHLIRARKLLEYGLCEEAAGEVSILIEVSHSDPHYWYNMARMALEAGLYRQVIKAGYTCYQLLARDGNSKNYKEVWQLLYPQAYWDHIQEYAGRHQLDPFLVSALMRQESLFDPLSLSSAQAYGLMQIIPSTARSIASRINLFPEGDFEVEKLYQPEVNIAFGCQELADLLEKYQGNLIFALISYNAGESVLKKWCQRYDTSNLDEFVEKISYKETRNYVKKVIRNYGLYSQLYKESSIPAAPVLAEDQAAQ